MTTALVSHSDCLDHVTPHGHPERADRLRRVLEALAGEEFHYLARVDAPLAEDEHILRVHPAAHLRAIEAASPADGFFSIDADTYMCPGSLRAARRAAGAVVRAVDMVMSGEVANAFCAVRPPGHHAEPETAMGFCLFGNVAIGAMHAIAAHGLERVAIVDFDVHHGNGTQALLWNEARVAFASIQQMPLYPGTGHPDERGAHGQIVNVALRPGAGGAEFRAAMEARVLPAIEAHRPELVLISAGFDAHARDPLANLNLVEADFAWATRALCRIAARHAGGRVVSTLEGGYDLNALAASVAAHVRVLMDEAHGGGG
jgi:acetoin utilization deacetylase AcuC-like enzyme